MCTGAEALFGASVLLGATSKRNQGGNEREAAEFQAREAEADAAAERQAARDLEQAVRKQGRYARGTARADTAAAGVVVGSGTSELIDQEIVRSSEEEAMNSILYGERRARRFEREAEGLRAVGLNAQRSRNSDAFGSLLAGGAMLLGGGWRGGGGGGGGGGPIVIDQ